MNCEDVRRHWHLYHDSEGDAELHFQINEHLEGCQSCEEWVSKESQFEQLIADRLVAQAPDRELWNHVLVGAGVVRPASSRRWTLFAIVACAASVLVALGLWPLWGPQGSREDASLSELTAGWHQRLTSGAVDVQFQSDSDLAVEDYLRKEVSFSVRCPPRKDAGFAVEGAGTCRLANQSAAYLVGKVDAVPVSIFILSRDSLPAFAHQQEALAKESVHRCREGQFEMALSVVDRNLVLVVGQVEPEQLVRVLSYYGTYPHVKAI